MPVLRRRRPPGYPENDDNQPWRLIMTTNPANHGAEYHGQADRRMTYPALRGMDAVIRCGGGNS
jgi:hypothetical protein